MHLGHALSALIGSDWARRLAGRFLLRIEDIDVGRTRENFIASILRDMDWLGIAYERPILRQSQHFPVYQAAATQLRMMGLLYPCFATRAEIAVAARTAPAAVDPDGAPLYPGLHKGLTGADIAARMVSGEPLAWRLHMDRALAEVRRRLGGRSLTFDEIDLDGRIAVVEARAEQWGDAILVRKDVPTSYHLSVVVDDARQGVTHVTRGRDLYAATGIHRLLQVLLGLPAPLYYHHRLIEDCDGRKLSKSAGSTSLRHLREGGLSVPELRRMLGL